MTAKSKGSRIQLKLITRLEEKGHLVAKVEQGGKFTKVKDMFGLFDLACMTKSGIVLIQVTCNKPHTHSKYIKFSKEYDFAPYIQYEQWVWYDRKGWKAFNYRDGEKYVSDLRK